MLGRQTESARMQSDFYRDQFRKTLRRIMGCVVLIYVLIFAILYFVFIQAPQEQYASTVDGKIMPMPNKVRMS